MPELILPANMKNLKAMIAFIKNEAARADCLEKELQHIHLVSEETLVNIIRYAYPGKEGDIKINCLVDVSGKKVTLTIADTGIPFNPLSAPEPDVKAPVQKRTIGGLGIYLVRKIMDEVNYKRENNSNILTMTKTCS